jgi:transcriptional regulator with XRE-family HTH domain
METNAPRYEEEFAERLRQVRIERGLSQAEVAQMATELGLPGMHQQTIQKIESKKRPIRLNEAEVLAQVVGMAPVSSVPLSATTLTNMIATLRATIDWFDSAITTGEAKRAAEQETLRETERGLALLRAAQESNVLRLPHLEDQLRQQEDLDDIWRLVVEAERPHKAQTKGGT